MFEAMWYWGGLWGLRRLFFGDVMILCANGISNCWKNSVVCSRITARAMAVHAVRKRRAEDGNREKGVSDAETVGYDTGADGRKAACGQADYI